MNRAQAFGYDLPVAAVAAEDMAVHVQEESLANSRRFLPHGEVGGSLVVVWNLLVAA